MWSSLTWRPKVYWWLVKEQPQRQEGFIASAFCLTSVLEHFKDAASSPQTKWLPEAPFLNPTVSFPLACVSSYPRQALQSPFLFPYPYQSTLPPFGLFLHTLFFFSFPIVSILLF